MSRSQGLSSTPNKSSSASDMLDLGCQLILIDGAIDRKSIASPDTSDAIILIYRSRTFQENEQGCGRNGPCRESLQIT